MLRLDGTRFGGEGDPRRLQVSPIWLGNANGKMPQFCKNVLENRQSNQSKLFG